MGMVWIRVIGAWVVFLAAVGVARAERVLIAAAADLKWAMDEVIASHRQAHPADAIAVTYGSSGKFLTQVRQGAPFDLYFSADTAYPEALVREGLVPGPVQRYARGRLVLWSQSVPAAALNWQALVSPAVRRVAIANPAHAPYGQRAREALMAAGVWAQVEPKLVLGENIAQAAQFVQTGNAEAGLVALSLVSGPRRPQQGHVVLVPQALHSPLDQGFVLTRKGAANPAARRFAEYVQSPAARAILASYGFELP